MAHPCEDRLPILIAELRERLEDDKEVVRTDDEFLSKCIRIRDFDVDRALIAVRKYYKYIDRNSDRLHGRPSQFIPVYDSSVLVTLKGRCKNGSKVLWYRIGAWNPRQWKMRDFQSAYLQELEYHLEDKKTQSNGISLIIDLNGMSLSHLTALTPAEIKLNLMIMQDGLPMKIAGLHIINYPSIFWGVYYIAQRFMKEKTRNRLHLHRSLDLLQDHFHKDTLPNALGGLLEMEDASDVESHEELLRRDWDYERYYKPRSMSSDSNHNDLLTPTLS